ncbi:MAG: oligosaccharide flippase family protein [Clostridia bacterium]|nr:oligosaccharide flippase family protein [Clostridia bacterium]MBQ3482681.1 oligosaccharide flippase family protein [Clostridia bacterium]
MISNEKQVRVGAILSYASIALSILAGLVYIPWMIEQIGQAQYGLYTLSNTLITLFVVDFGLGKATERYVAKYRAQGHPEKIGAFLGAIYKLYLIIDMVIFAVLVILFFLLDQIYVKLTPTELAQFKVVYIISGLFTVVKFPFIPLDGILNAHEKYIPMKIADLLYRVLQVGLTVLALLLDQGLYALVTVNALVGLVLIAYKWIVFKSTVGVRASLRHTDRALYRKILSFSVWILIDALAARLVFQITPSILGIVASAAAIGVFGVITTIEGYVYTVATAINGLFLPRVARINVGENAEENLSALVLGVGRFQYALNGLVVAGFAVVGRLFIRLWMGEAFAQAYFGILLVIVPGLFYNALQIANTALVVKKRVKERAFIALATGVANVILSFIFSYRWGVIGACLSIFVAYMLREVLSLIVYRKHLHLNIIRFAKCCYLRMTPPILLTVAAGLLINRLIPDGGWLSLVVKGMITVAVYGVTLWLFALSRAERKRSIEIVRSKIKKHKTLS